MCSVSWIHHNEGYDLFFNRDEQRSRPMAIPPKIWNWKDGSYLAPQDPQAGGTWIFTNDQGLSACLLNAYQLENVASVATPRSRGLLVKDLAECKNIKSLEKQLNSQVSEASYAPFYLLALEKESEPKFWLWYLTKLQELHLPELPFWSTTSVNPDQVLPYRKQLVKESISKHGLNCDGLKALHLSIGIPSTEKTIKMSRNDAKTLSFTHIQVQSQNTTMHYATMDSEDFSEAVTNQIPLLS